MINLNKNLLYNNNFRLMKIINKHKNIFKIMMIINLV